MQNFYTRVRFYGILTGDLRIHRRRCQSLDVLWLPQAMTMTDKLRFRIGVEGWRSDA